MSLAAFCNGEFAGLAIIGDGENGALAEDAEPSRGTPASIDIPCVVVVLCWIPPVNICQVLSAAALLLAGG